MKPIVILFFAAALPLAAQSSFYSEQEFQLGHSVFASTLSDLQAARASAPANLVDEARSEVRALSRNWENGVYDHHQMDAVISSVEAIVDRTVSLPARVNLGTDVSRLLDLRREFY